MQDNFELRLDHTTALCERPGNIPGSWLMDGPQHRFGGPWTEEKLDRVTRYLRAYTRALHERRFRLMYIDAFAGTGYRTTKRKGDAAQPWLPGIDEFPEVAELAKGSARRALEIDPPFDHYVFIEADKANFKQLQDLANAFPHYRDRIELINADANSTLIEICSKTHWQSMRAVAFLDPYGMEVKWSTVEAIAKTRYIDFWYLFPVNAVQRVIQPLSDAPPGWDAAVDRILGYGWRDRFFETIEKSTLFGQQPQEQKKTDLMMIETYMRERLDCVFQGGVAPRALQLRNSRKICLFLLYFACGNPSPLAHGLAMRIATNILQ
jgi:three-Cys-motif partner protein